MQAELTDEQVKSELTYLNNLFNRLAQQYRELKIFSQKCEPKGKWKVEKQLDVLNKKMCDCVWQRGRYISIVQSRNMDFDWANAK